MSRIIQGGASSRKGLLQITLLIIIALIITEWFGITRMAGLYGIDVQDASARYSNSLRKEGINQTTFDMMQGSINNLHEKIDAMSKNTNVKNVENKFDTLVETISEQFESVSGEVKKAKTELNSQFQALSQSLQSTNSQSQIDFNAKSFCINWSPEDALNRTMQPFDTWMLHNPQWLVVNETKSEFCVQRGDLQNERIKEFLIFYATQFYSSCKKVNWRYHWLSGWGATFLNMQAGLRDSADNLHIPLTMSFGGEDRSKWKWNYAANKIDGSNATCPTADTDCYFLPHHNCGTHEELKTGSTRVEKIESTAMPPDSDVSTGSEKAMNAYLFMTRKQLWLRRAVFDVKREFRAKAGSETDCTVIHVRRGDAVLDRMTRRYFPIKSYLEAIPKDKLRNPNHTIFLVTDDSNAIDEALEFYGNLRWKYFERERAKGSEAGWEGHTPSRDPASEVITLLALFDLVQDCSVLVHSHSNLSYYLWAHMLESPMRDEMERISLENGTAVYNAAYNTTEKELNALLEEMRKNISLAKIDGI